MKNECRNCGLPLSNHAPTGEFCAGSSTFRFDPIEISAEQKDYRNYCPNENCRCWIKGKTKCSACGSRIHIENDMISQPPHYTKHPSGIECIQITEHMGFCLGNAIKYIWRADLKGGSEDLKKAIWYLQREIEKRGLSGVHKQEK